MIDVDVMVCVSRTMHLLVAAVIITPVLSFDGVSFTG